MFADMSEEQQEDTMRVSQFRRRIDRYSRSPLNGLMPLAIAIFFGFTPIAYLILYLPLFAALPTYFFELFKIILVYLVPAAIVYGLYQRRAKNIDQDKQVLQLMETEYRAKWHRSKRTTE